MSFSDLDLPKTGEGFAAQFAQVAQGANLEAQGLVYEFLDEPYPWKYTYQLFRLIFDIPSGKTVPMSIWKHVQPSLALWSARYPGFFKYLSTIVAANKSAAAPPAMAANMSVAAPPAQAPPSLLTLKFGGGPRRYAPAPVWSRLTLPPASIWPVHYSPFYALRR